MARRKREDMQVQQEPANQVAVAPVMGSNVSVLPHAKNAPTTVLSGDLIVPSVYLMQGLSDLVSARKANQGDIIRSTTAEVLGGPDKPVDFIPLMFTQSWVLSEKVGNKFEYRGTEPLIAINQNLPWDFLHGGIAWKRTKSFNMYALLPGDINKELDAVAESMKTGALPDANVSLMPVMISFRSTSYKAGKTIATHIANLQSLRARYPQVPAYQNLENYSYVLQLKCKSEKNDMGTYYVYEVATKGPTQVEHMAAAQGWIQTLQTTQHQVDESATVVADSDGIRTNY